VLDDSPLVVLAQQGAEMINLIIAEKSAGIPWREPSVDGNNRARRAQSERDHLCNAIEDRRHLRRRTPSPPRWSLAEDVAPMGRSGFPALAEPLRQVWWSDKFKTGNIDRYNNSSNAKEFI
jgi:hypothetical protein